MEGGGEIGGLGSVGGGGRAAGDNIEEPADRSSWQTIRIPFVYNYKDNTLTRPLSNHTMKVRLLQKPNEFCIELMTNVRHRNILHIEVVLDTGEVIVQDYTGDLMPLIKRFAETETSTDFLQDYLRQIIEGITELAYNGCYHGNFFEGQTFYTMKEGSYVVKLTDFRSKGETELLVCQREDWFGIGCWIESLVDHFKKQNYLFDTSELEDLGVFLKSALKSNKGPKELKDLALDHCYFWGKQRRVAFFVCHVPRWLSESSPFREKITNDFECPYPWNDESNYDGYYGLLKALNDYRENNSRTPYDGKSKLDYLRFVCGSYTHENEIKENITYTIRRVDPVFRICDPKLCVKVTKILRICHLVPSV